MFANKHIVITVINSVIYYKCDRKYYNYSSDGMHSFELIYKFSGEDITSFNGTVLYSENDTVEYLPLVSKPLKYMVNVKKAGDGIDIFFSTNSDMPATPFAVSVKNNLKLKVLFQKIQKLWFDKNEEYYHECMSVLYSIIALVQLLSESAYISGQQYEKIKPGIDYINNHCFEQTFDLNTSSVLCNMSYTYFKKLFTAKYKMPPVKYITLMKIKYACDLLKTHKYSITDISEILGYENVYYFSRVFKKTMNCSPTEYKNSY